MKYLFIAVMALLLSTAMRAQQVQRVKMDDVVKIIDSSTGPLVINFWATWCAPCVHEIPWFEKFVYVDTAHPAARLILVSLDFKEDFPKNIAAFVSKNHYRSQILWLEETNADSFCPKIDASWEGAIPASLFVNKARNYRKFVGRQLTEPQFKLELEALTR